MGGASCRWGVVYRLSKLGWGWMIFFLSFLLACLRETVCGREGDSNTETKKNKEKYLPPTSNNFTNNSPSEMSTIEFK